MPRMCLIFGGSLDDLCQELETELSRNFLVDITPEKVSFDVHKPGDREFDYKCLKIIIVRFRGMYTNVRLASVALLNGHVIYDDSGAIYAEQKTVVQAIKKICK